MVQILFYSVQRCQPISCTNDTPYVLRMNWLELRSVTLANEMKFRTVKMLHSPFTGKEITGRKLAFFMSEWPLTMAHKRQISMQNHRPHRFHRNKQKNIFDIVKRNIIVVRVFDFLVASFYCSNVNINSTKPYFHRSFDFLSEAFWMQTNHVVPFNRFIS